MSPFIILGVSGIFHFNYLIFSEEEMPICLKTDSSKGQESNRNLVSILLWCPRLSSIPGHWGGEGKPALACLYCRRLWPDVCGCFALRANASKSQVTCIPCRFTLSKCGSTRDTSYLPRPANHRVSLKDLRCIDIEDVKYRNTHLSH